MGNNQQQIYQMQNFDPNDYYTYSAEKKKQYQFYGQFVVLKHHITNEMVDKYQVSLNSREDFQAYMDQFYWRASEDTLVNTIHLKQKHEEGFCSTTYIVDVYIEHITSRLSEVTDIPYLDNLYLMKRCLQGFEKIYKRQGYIKVKQSHICFDSNGIVKVWLNENLSKNYPDPLQNNTTTQNKTESDMVNQIVKIISENADNDSDLMSFQQYYNQQKIRNVTFQQALDLLQRYEKTFKTIIPDFFQAIVRMNDKSCDEDHQNFQEIHDHGIFNPPKQSARFPQNHHEHQRQEHKSGNYIFSQPTANAIQAHHHSLPVQSQFQPHIFHQSHIESTKKHSPPNQHTHLDTIYTLANKSSQQNQASNNIIHFQRNDIANFPIQKIQKLKSHPIQHNIVNRYSPPKINTPVYRPPITNHQHYQSNIVQPLPARSASYSQNKPQVKIFFNNNPVQGSYVKNQSFNQNRQSFQRPTSLQKTVNVIRHQQPSTNLSFQARNHNNQIAAPYPINNIAQIQRKSESPNKIYVHKVSPVSENKLINAIQQQNVAQASFQKDLQNIKNQQNKQSKNKSFHHIQQTQKDNVEKQQYQQKRKQPTKERKIQDDMNELQATKKYYTVQAEAEIDPQIAADLLKYQNDGDLP